MCMYMRVPEHTRAPVEARRGQEWTEKQLWIVRCGCWERNRFPERAILLPINGKLSIKCSSFPNFFWRSKPERMLVKFIHIVYYLLVYGLWQNIMTKAIHASRWLRIQHSCRQESLQKAPGMVAWTTESSHLQEQAWTRKNRPASWVSELSKPGPGDLLPLAKPNLLNLP